MEAKPKVKRAIRDRRYKRAYRLMTGAAFTGTLGLSLSLAFFIGTVANREWWPAVPGIIFSALFLVATFAQMHYADEEDVF